MNLELRELLSQFELVKDKIDDVLTKHTWFVDEIYISRDLYNKKDVEIYGYGYSEHRIHNNQMLDLMLMYIKEFDELIKKFHEIEKASSVKSGNGTDNA
ncbi:DUF1474 family protein [Staphylococcus simulans]|uniref:type II toxin-antitoxin system toxin TscT n=1 Tax=Staphylococcus simulans TaxID=1286 RepID=UPI00255565E7|nr:DUF1474 family protein [Staphylococcus simulans]MDK8176491.1 DUF1474 family protein [Staphylococcus simulans]